MGFLWRGVQERRSGEAEREGYWCKILKAGQPAFVLVSPSAELGEKEVPNMSGK